MIAHGLQQRSSHPRRRGTRGVTGTVGKPPSTPAGEVSPADSPEPGSDSPGDAGEDAAAEAPDFERYEVEKILGSRVQDGCTEFLIRWKGWSSAHDSWQDADAIDVDPVAAFYGWAPMEKSYEKFEHSHHPKLAAAQPDWRRKKAVREVKHMKPKYSQRLTADSEEREGSHGWKAKQLKHERHKDFAKHNPDYTPGLKTRPAAGAPPGKWADLWLPREVWNLESSQSNLYAEQKLKAKLDSGKDLDSADLAFARHNGFSPDSVKLFHCIQLLVHGDHHISYDVDHCWGTDSCRNFGGWIKDRMSRSYYRAHCRFLHFSDNEDEELHESDPGGVCSISGLSADSAALCAHMLMHAHCVLTV
jgi:hypothetical protein